MLDLCDRLNNQKITQGEIAEAYHIHPAQFSRFVHLIFDKRFILKPEIEEYLTTLEQTNHERLGNERRTTARVIDFATYRQSVEKKVREPGF